MTDPTHDENGFEIMYEGESGWSDWIHPQPGYRVTCCDCGLVHDIEFQLVKQEDVDGLSNHLRQPGETKQKAILFRARSLEPTPTPNADGEK